MLALTLCIAAPAAADVPALGTYLRARAAEGDGRIGVAAADYARVLAAVPANGDVALRAFRSALAAGDIPLAERAAAALQRDAPAPADVALLPLAQAAARGGALPTGPDANADNVARRLSAETRALLLIAGPDPDAGADAVAALAGSDAAADLRLAAAELLYGAGRPQRAAALLPVDDATFAALRARPVAARATLSFGVSWLLTRVAADLIGADPGPLSITFARTATIAEPGNDRARLLLAAMLARGGARADALAAIDAVAPAGPFADAAVSLRVAILADGGDTAAVLAAARVQATRPGAGISDWANYADRLLAADRAAEAAPWYKRVVEGEGAQSWLAWMQYGGALDQAGDWNRARPALERALALGPDRALTLNYLGYALIEHDEDKARALTLLQRAAAIAPGDASIADSLGWARFKTGDVAGALPLIEQAAQASPANAEIALHLGDIYWAVGRRYEARYAWRAGAIVATGAEAATLAARIASGPSPSS